jgi:small subunit ribosomal protein S16
MKMMGRRHRPFFRLCAVDGRGSRDGKVIEYLGYYDPMIRETDARAVLNSERIDYWLGVGAIPSDKVKVLIKKYGTDGTHQEQQKAALERIKASKPTAPPPMAIPKPKPEAAAPAEEAPEAAAETPAESEAPASEAPAEEAASQEPAAEAEPEKPSE